MRVPGPSSLPLLACGERSDRAAIRVRGTHQYLSISRVPLTRFGPTVLATLYPRVGSGEERDCALSGHIAQKNVRRASPGSAMVGTKPAGLWPAEEQSSYFSGSVAPEEKII